jgi:hypothetical protein
MGLTFDAIDSSSDDEVLALLGKELETRILVAKNAPEFIHEIRNLPVGLRAMAATHQLDVSLALDDLGWHFGNWHSAELAEETARGLEELGAADLARVFRDVFRIAQEFWPQLGAEDWMDWYHGSPFEKATDPLTEEARSILARKGGNGIFKYWVDYARRYPERVGAVDND